ncbi:MAG: beta-ketoacyl-ACP synthase III [Alphaproteobacteria bacterium]|jgi:beta-ketodecanoyl-[acyl-carrier-protein] synthase|nr:beta-ketoacyl-ACP synthase III [Alphaproteobacteria bacterium]MBT4911665.1 beta-ketoacyl-ACP synthase III [Alphaproteobacteria bacterium]
MEQIVISGTGVFTPEESITNKELVKAYNSYAETYNSNNKVDISRGNKIALELSSEEFIYKASGIKSRYVMDKKGILDPDIMHPILDKRSNDEPSILAEMSVKAAKKAMDSAGKTSNDIDAVITACSNLERAYPAISIEVQQLLGVSGFAFDMNVACSSATFAIQAAADMIRSGSAKTILIVNPEICSGHLDFKDRDCHFIFGDVCTALILESKETAKSNNSFEIVSTKCITQFSNNIRNNFGFLNNAKKSSPLDRDLLFMQEGRKVFKEVVPMVSQLITDHIEKEKIKTADIKRLWLHQANKSMNDFIGKKVLGRAPEDHEQPNILQDYANTSSAGSIIAFSLYSEDMKNDEIGVLCSFGAGYSAGSIILKKTS